jgi:hypothetical protein
MITRPIWRLTLNITQLISTTLFFGEIIFQHLVALLFCRSTGKT